MAGRARRRTCRISARRREWSFSPLQCPLFAEVTLTSMLDPSEKSFAAGAQAPVPDVERERCDFIYRRALPGTGAALAFSLLLSAYLLRVRPAELVLLWLALAIGCAGYFAALALAYRRSRESAEPQLWLRRAAFAAAHELASVFASAYGVRSAYRRLADDNAEVQTQLAEQLDSLLEAHREVQAYGRKLALFSERAPIAVLETDARGTILEMNPAAE